MSGQPSRQQQESGLQIFMLAIAALYAFLQANLTGCATHAGKSRLVDVAGAFSSSTSAASL